MSKQRLHQFAHPPLGASQNLLHEANAAVDDDQWSNQMITSLDNLANAAVQKNVTVEWLVLANKLLMDTVAKLQEDNTKLLTVIQQLAQSGHTQHPSQAHSSTPK